MADALRIDDNMMFLTALTVIDNVIHKFLLIIVILLWQQDILCAIRNTAPQCDKPCASSHNLNNGTSLMGSGSIAHLVNGIHGRINCRVKSNGILGTCNIQINRSGNTDRIDSQRRQLLRPFKRTVAANDYNAVNAMFAANLCS